MKRNFDKILLIVVSFTVASCSNPEDKKYPIILQTTDKDVTSSQPQSLKYLNLD